MPGILSGQGFSFSVDLRRLFRRFRLTGLEITPSKRNDLQTLIPRPAIPFQIVLQLQYAFHIDQRTAVQFSFCELRGDSAKSNDLIILRSCVSSLTGALRKIKPKIAEYLRDRRLCAAASQLLLGSSVTETAMDSGFDTVSG